MYGFSSVKFQKFGIGVDVGNGAVKRPQQCWVCSQVDNLLRTQCEALQPEVKLNYQESF